MQTSDVQQKLKQAKFIFWINLAMALFAFSIFIKSFDSHQSWKIVCSGAGFSIFLGLTTLLFVQMRKLQKEVRN
jgi:glucan phosphoethanolaminetransferase (alkaline phosphatase superfamily)